MFKITPPLKLASLALAIACGSVVAPHASAEHDQQDRRVEVQRDTHRGSVRVEINTHRNHDRHDRYQRRHSRPAEHRPACHTPPPRHCSTSRRSVQAYPPPRPHGYWKSVYRPPVYRTVYDRCGYPRRVMVQRGYHERVWVERPRHGHIY